MSGSTPSPSRPRTWLPPIALLVVGGVLFPTAGRDDKFITYWPAWTLAEWGEIVNYNGDRIEQSSSILHVFAIALATKISSLPPPVTGWAISVAAGVLGVWLTGRIAERIAPGTGVGAGLLVAVAAPYAYWSFSGMETPLVAASALGMLLAIARLADARPTLPALAAGALAFSTYLLVRPESPMVLLCVVAGGLGLELARRWAASPSPTPTRDAPAWLQPVTRWLPALALACILTLVIALLRLAYFDSPLPQPVYAKSAPFSAATLRQGVSYLFREGAHFVLIPLACLGAARVLLRALRGPRETLRSSVALFFVAYTSFIVLTGGGWMEATRFVGHMFPAIALLCLEALAGLPRPAWRPILAGGLVCVALAGSVRIAQVHSSSMPLWAILASDREEDPRFSWIIRYNLSNRRDIEMFDAADAVLTRLIAAQDEKVIVLAYNTGMVMYYSALAHFGQFGTIDLHGLSDRFVTRSTYDDGIRRFALGLRWSIVDFLRIQPELNSQTGADAPHVVFCAAWPMDARGVSWVEAEGFTLAYWQLREFDSGTRFLPGRGVEASQILAVRDAYALAVADMSPVHVPPAPDTAR